MTQALLPQRGLIRLYGEDTVTFLQGLVSNDVTRLVHGHAVYAALLSPQGKFLHDFFIIRRGDDYLLDTEASRVAELMQRLKMYKLRSKVTIEPLGESVSAIWNEKPSADGFIYADPRLPELGFRGIGLKTSGDADAYDAFRLSLGVPDGSRDMLVDKTLLLDVGFEQLHGVDFNKGCYVGQEVTARSKFRGQVKKSIYQVSGPSLPAPGTALYADGQEAGVMRSSRGSRGIAILRVELVEQAKHILRANDREITAMRPAWISALAQ